MTPLPLARRPSSSTGSSSGAGGSVHDQLVVCKERADRLTSDNADLNRRLKERDDRVNELQKQLAAAQARGSKVRAPTCPSQPPIPTRLSLCAH